jgi:DNA-binding LacI/PurR family transcriptional regulator
MEINKNLTIDDIARELGVSKTTVSRAISGKGRISEATRQRVQEYIQAHHYHPNAAAKSLAESRTYNIALVLPRSFIKLNQTHVRQSMSAICEEAFLQDYNIMLCLSTDDATPSLLRTIDNRKVDGVILARTVARDPVVALLSQRGIPFATIGSLSPEDQGKAVVEADHDQVGGCRAFSKAFFQSGSGKMALLGNDLDYIVNQSRLTGFRQAAKELDIPESMIEVRLGLDNRPSRHAAVEELIA